jgi:hypothetical protein
MSRSPLILAIPTPVASAGLSWTGRVSSSTIWKNQDDHGPLNAFDGVGNGQWAPESSDVNPWIRIDFPSPVKCDILKIRSRVNQCFDQAPTKIKVWGSRDGQIFYKLDTIIGFVWVQGEWKEIPFRNSESWLTYRIVLTKPQHGGTQIGLGQLNIGYREQD